MGGWPETEFNSLKEGCNRVSTPGLWSPGGHVMSQPGYCWSGGASWSQEAALRAGVRKGCSTARQEDFTWALLTRRVW